MHSRRMGSRSAGALAGDGRNFAQAGFNLNMGVFKSAVQGIHERPHRIIVLPESIDGKFPAKRSISWAR